MNFFFVDKVMATVEPLLIVAVLMAFFKARERGRFPAFAAYLVLRLVSTVVLSILLGAHKWLHLGKHAAYAAYYYSYWASYLAGAILVFLVVQELFRHAMTPLPGLSRLGLIAFRWVAVSSLIFAGASVFFPLGANRSAFVAIPMEMMRCVSLLELCLLAFLATSVRTLGLSFRSRVFGIGLGFGFFASMEFLTSALAFRHPNLASPVNAISQVITTLGLLMWTVYFLLPEPERKPLLLPVTSPLLRWNDIAVALGHPPPQVALAQSNDSFLEDVEKVVDRILAKNSMNVAS